MKIDITLLTGVFEKFSKVSTEDYGINPLYCVSICSSFLQCCLKYTDIKLQLLQDKDMISLNENNIRCGKSKDKGDHYIKSDENKKILHKDATNL